MYESPQGRIHQASRSMNNTQIYQPQNPIQNVFNRSHNPFQNAPARLTQRIGNPLSSDVNSTIHRAQQAQEINIAEYSAVQPTREKQRFIPTQQSRSTYYNEGQTNRSLFFPNQNSRVIQNERQQSQSLEFKNVTQLIRNGNRYVILDILDRRVELEQQRQMQSLNSTAAQDKLNTNSNPNNHQDNYQDKINGQSTNQKPEISVTNFEKDQKISFNQLNICGNKANDQCIYKNKNQNKNHFQHPNNHSHNFTSNIPQFQNQQNYGNQLNIQTFQQKSNSILHAQKFNQYSHQKKKFQTEKNQQVSKVNKHKNAKEQSDKKAAQKGLYSSNIPDWFVNYDTLFKKTVFPFLTQQMAKQAKNSVKFNTRSKQFEKLVKQIYLPKQQQPQIYVQRLFNEHNLFVQNIIGNNNNNIIQKIIEETLKKQQPKVNPLKKEEQQQLITPFDKLKITYGPSNSYGKDQQDEDPYKLPIPLKQRFVNPSKQFFQKLIALRRQAEQIQKNQPHNTRKSQRGFRPTNYNPNNSSSSSQTKTKNQSTNDKTTTSSRSFFKRIHKLQKQQPKISEFNVSPYDKPYTKHYTIVVQNLECNKLKWPCMKQKNYLKKSFEGKVQFQRFTSQIQVNDVLVRDLLQKQKKLEQIFKDSRSTADKYGLLKWFSPRFDLKLKGLLILPLQLQLPQGYDYFYSYYLGDRICDLVIFNQFAQVSFLEEIMIKENCQEQRNLKDKIRFNNDGIWIGCQMLKRKCQFMFWGTQEKLDQLKNPDLTEDEISQKIIPKNNEGKAYDVYYDPNLPERLYGEIEWKKEKTSKSQNQSKTQLFWLSIVFLFFMIIIV